MPFEETFLKLYTDAPQWKTADTNRSSEREEPAEMSAAAQTHSAEQEVPADFPEAETPEGENILYFSPWDRNEPAAAQRYDSPQPFRPTDWFRRLYAESAQRRGDEFPAESPRMEENVCKTALNEKELSETALNETVPGPTAQKMAGRTNRSETASDEPHLKIDPVHPAADSRMTSFSVMSYSTEDYPPAEEPNLRLFNEEQTISAEEVNRETVFNLSGQKQEISPVSETARERACPITVPSWPESVERVRQRGRTAFGEWIDALRREMARGFRIIGFGSTAHQAGTSTLMLGLAGELAARHYSVLVLDADFENPSLASQIGMNPVSGWEKFLHESPDTESESLYRVTVQPQMPKRGILRHRASEPLRGEEKFHLLPLNPRQAAAAVALSCRRSWLSRFLELAESFDLVLIDHGVILSGDSRCKLSEMLRFGEDGWFLIDSAKNPAADSAGPLIEEAQEKDLVCLGRIENFIE